MRRLVVFGEGHGHLLLVTGLAADELILETGDEFLGSEHQRLVRACAAIEGGAVDLADIVDRHAVAFGGLTGLRFVAARRFGDTLDLLVDLRIRNIEHLTRHLDVREILDFNRRDDLVVQAEFEVGAAGEDLLGLFLILGHDHFGLHGGLLTAPGNDRTGRIR